MKINLNKEILNRDGKQVISKVKTPFLRQNEEGEMVEEFRFVPTVLTLGKALRDSVLTSNMMSSLTIEEKLARYNLFLKIEKDEEVEVTEDDLKNLTQYACDRYEVIYFGTIVSLME